MPIIFSQGSLSDTHLSWMRILSIVGGCLSVLSLALCLIATFLLRSMRQSERRFMSANLFACLLVAQFVFVVGIELTSVVLYLH